MTEANGVGEPSARHLRGPTCPRRAKIEPSTVKVFRPPPGRSWTMPVNGELVSFDEEWHCGVENIRWTFVTHHCQVANNVCFLLCQKGRQGGKLVSLRRDSLCGENVLQLHKPEPAVIVGHGTEGNLVASGAGGRGSCDGRNGTNQCRVVLEISNNVSSAFVIYWSESLMSSLAVCDVVVLSAALTSAASNRCQSS